ncbi:MAG: hypothetical protein AB7V45_04010 [Candidatus Krumholzibacteriia bacterium]
MNLLDSGRTGLPRALAWSIGLMIAGFLANPSGGFAAVHASQTLSLYRYEGGNETTISSTAIGRTGTRWRVRGAVSWWRWDPDPGTGLSSEAGVGTIDITLGRSLWSSFDPKATSRGWAQVRSAIPLAMGPTPLSSGEFDWGLSLLTMNRFRDFLVLAELGYLSPGDPAGITYDSRFSVATSASWRPGGAVAYPVASYARGGSTFEGTQGFGEWSVGLGVRAGRRTGVLVLYSQGTTDSSPDRGISMVVTRRL